MYGPPIDPRQVLAPASWAEDPGAFAVCLAVGLLLVAAAAWKRPPAWVRILLFAIGVSTVLTMPLLGHLDHYVFGAFPTIDKEGSLLFYLDGVHRRMLADPAGSLSDPAARLIGVHVGHLWLTQLFDTLLSPIGAFNAQAWLYPPLGWWACWLLLRDVCGDARVAAVLGFPFGLGLHVFRDLNWYTIEKAAVFWLALFAWALYRAWERGGRWRLVAAGLYVVMAWMNLYLGLVGAFLGALALGAATWSSATARSPSPGLLRLSATCAACAVAASPLALWQWKLMASGPALGTPEQFLWERAALDAFSLMPLAWNRLEAWRALSWLATGLALFALARCRDDARVRFSLFAGLVLFSLSLGPLVLPGVKNPLYMALHAVVPGFWRMAKPEVFFEGTWLLMLASAAVALKRLGPSDRTLAALFGLMLLGWLVDVRSHPVYPTMTLPVGAELAPGWERRVFR